jgi:glycosyltransferase involved in cell wall biosynthesis
MDDERLKRTYDAIQRHVPNLELYCNPPLAWGNMDILHAHDLDALPPCVYYKITHGMRPRIVYDAHEDWQSHRLLAAKLAERTMLPFIDAITSPSPSITSKLANRTCIKDYRLTQTILNCPDLPDPPSEPKYPNFTVAYTGHISPIRGYGHLLEAARILNQKGFTDIHYLFMGRGNLDIPADLALQCTATRQLAHEEMMKRLQRCHIGVILFDDTPNHRIALPHKLFEYMAAGLPVIYPNYCSEIDNILLPGGIDHCCGYPVNPSDHTDLATGISALQRSTYEHQELSCNCLAAARATYNSRVQGEKLAALYKALTAKLTTPPKRSAFA